MIRIRALCYALILGVVLALPTLGAGGGARACSIDGVPSITVNGHAVIINKVPPVGKNLSVWAPFLAAFPLHTGQSEALSEIRQRVAMSIEGFKYPWRWNFGDGSPTARGTQVHHVFKHAGIYKITVEAYFATHKFWYTFDAIQIRVLKN